MSAKKIVHYAGRFRDPRPKAIRRTLGRRRYADSSHMCAIHDVLMQRVEVTRWGRNQLITICPKCHKAQQPVNPAALAGKRKKRDRRGQTRPR